MHDDDMFDDFEDQDDRDDEDPDFDDDFGDIDEDDEEAYMHKRFADPGGNSSLYRASASNPRNLPCPTCKAENRLTPRDRAAGYQCDQCADAMERGGF